jgi:antitoxin component of RelBE/YafQ-DinJ toxin-antitoxin module
MVVEKGVILTVRITADLKDMVDTAAKKSGLTSSDWTRAVLARAANEGAFAPRKGDRHGTRSRKPSPK